MGSKNHGNLGHRVVSSFHVNWVFWIYNKFRVSKKFHHTNSCFIISHDFCFYISLCIFFLINCGGVDLSLAKRSSDFRWASAQ